MAKVLLPYASICTSRSGHKVGLYTSPHLKDFRERIKINGADITEDLFVTFINDNKPFFESNDISFFRNERWNGL
jgi:dihydrofolate synthase/folylpolyglutamate synthase